MLPLNGVRVLAVEQYGAGPFGTMFLADQGAEVIKIENPNDGGDMSRAVGPYFFAPGDSEFFHSLNRNKKSLTLDLGRPEGQAVLQDLARTADAVASNLRGDVPVKLGLVYDRLKQVNPKIVCAHLSAYGRSGPRADWPGFDYLMQAEAGYFSLTSEPGAPPARFGISIVDLMTGLYAEPLPPGFGFSETAFRVFVLMASRRLKSDRFFTDDYRPEVYTEFGIDYIKRNSMLSVLRRHYPQLGPALSGVKNAFHPWKASKGPTE